MNSWGDVLKMVAGLTEENERLRQQVRNLELEVDSLEDDKANLLYELRKHKLQEDDLK